MISTTLNELIDDALGRTDREVDDVDRGWLARIAKIAVRNLWSNCVRLAPDQFTKTSASFTIASGNTHVIGTGDSVTDYLSFRGLEYDPGSGVFVPLRPYRFKDRASASRGGGVLQYRVYGSTIDVQPAELAGTYPLRFKYLFQPAFGTDDNTAIDLPLGADDYLAEFLAGKIRVRFEEPPDQHLTAQMLALQIVNRFLTGHDQGTPEQIPEAGDFPDDTGVGGW